MSAGNGDNNVGIPLWASRRTTWLMALAALGRITPHTKFHAQVYVLTKEEEVGPPSPFFSAATAVHSVRRT